MRSTQTSKTPPTYIVHCLRHAHNSHSSPVLLQDVLGKLSSLSVGVVSSNGVKNMDFVLDKSLSGNFQGSFSFLDKATLQTVRGVCQLE